jgi:hypothetical protein
MLNRMENVKVTPKKQARNNRDSAIITDFAAMGGTITARVRAISDKYKLAEITVRVILRKNALIGRNALPI